MGNTPDKAIFTAYEGYKSHDSSTAEKNLMRAILRMAMDDLSKHGQEQQEALTYLRSDDSTHLYSFVNICEQLELSPEKVRSLLGLTQTNERGFGTQVILSKSLNS